MRFASVLALAVLVPFIPSRARAADANLDPTFGTFGQTVVDVPRAAKTARADARRPTGFGGLADDKAVLVQ
jgi:hypothetical protein